MAVTTITSSTNRFSTLAATPAFADGTAGPDTLIVNADAFLIAAGTSSYGAHFDAAGAWSITINGTVLGTLGGLYLEWGNTAVSTISVGPDGAVGSITTSGPVAPYGIVAGSSATIKNAGEIFGSTGIVVGNVGTYSVTNSGTLVYGGITSLGGALTVVNSGQINHTIVGVKNLTNSGNVTGQVTMSDANGTVSNTGTLWIVTGGAGAYKLTNSKSIAAVNFSGSGVNPNVVENRGKIEYGVALGAGTDSFSNSGTIGTDALLGDGNNSFLNSGDIGGNVTFGIGNDIASNSGHITGTVALGDGNNIFTNLGKIDGLVSFGSGNDVFTNSGLIGNNDIFNALNMGGGDDKFTGGYGAEFVNDGGGSDTFVLGGGNDYLSAIFGIFDGNDVFDGGAGNDTYSVFSDLDLVINLDTVAHNYGLFPGGEPLRPAGTVSQIGAPPGSVVEKVRGFENASGGNGNDHIYGTASANILLGGGGINVVFGYGGNDTLVGGNDLDVLVGGLGKDLLTGNLGTDYFSYSSIRDSGITAATRDVIMDFQQGVDKIDIELIDANTANGSTTNEDFVFIGTNLLGGFTGTPGELRAYWTLGGQIIEADVNGDRKADFSIKLDDPLHSKVLTKSDFYQV